MRPRQAVITCGSARRVAINSLIFHTTAVVHPVAIPETGAAREGRRKERKRFMTTSGVARRAKEEERKIEAKWRRARGGEGNAKAGDNGRGKVTLSTVRWSGN